MKRENNKVIEKLMKFIPNFEEFDSENLFDIDVNTTELYSNIINGGDKWKRNQTVAYPLNCMKLLVSVMLSEKDNNFSQVKFSSEVSKFSKPFN